MFTFELINTLRKFYEWGISGNERDGEISVNLAMSKELKFWRQIKQHSPLNFSYRKYDVYTVLASDASQDRWGLSIDRRQIGGPYPEELKSECISVKEMFAVKILVDTVVSKHSIVRVLCDNAATGG